MNVINFTTEKRSRYTSEKKTDPEDLLPILREWRAADPEKYSTLVAIICGSASTDPEEIKRHSRKRQPLEKVIDFDKYFSYKQVDPEDLLPIFRKWKTAEPEKYSTIVAVICSSANVNAEDLPQKK